MRLLAEKADPQILKEWISGKSPMVLKRNVAKIQGVLGPFDDKLAGNSGDDLNRASLVVHIDAACLSDVDPRSTFNFFHELGVLTHIDAGPTN